MIWWQQLDYYQDVDDCRTEVSCRHVFSEQTIQVHGTISMTTLKCSKENFEDNAIMNR